MTDSDREATNNGRPVAGRRRFFLSRQAFMRIRSKLALILLIPLVALTGVTSLRLYDLAAESTRAGESAEIIELTQTVSRVIHVLQRERAEAAVQVHKDDESLELSDEVIQIGNFELAVDSVDRRLADLDDVRADFDGDAEIQSFLTSADKSIERLDSVRTNAYSGIEQVHLSVYNSAIASLSSVIDRAIELADSAELSRFLRAASLLATAGEASERLRVLVLSLRDGDAFDAEYRDFMTLSLARDQALSEYRSLGVDAEPVGPTVFEGDGLGARAARVANVLESTVAIARSDAEQELDHGALLEAYDARHTATAIHIDEALHYTVETVRTENILVNNRMLVEGGIVLAVLAGAVLVAAWLGRPVIRGLRKLRDSARQVATQDLPAAVKQVDEQEDLGGLTPQQFAERTTPPLHATGSAELVEVGDAFNEVHREAIYVAAQQALLRVHVGAMFVRLARRGHSLTGRLTATLDEAERDEQDPDRLQRLFRLDHLVSLLSRANDSLLVLGGTAPAKVRAADERVGDVLTAAQSHIEHYTRVNVGMVDEGVWVVARAVDDVVQLLAELMDNATRYSERPAEIMARFMTDQVTIQIRDFGIGIGREKLAKLNERLATQAPLDLDAMQALGLTVVGHLASRHEIEVELREATDRGMIAEVTLPAHLLSFASNTDPEQRGPAGIAAEPAAAPPAPPPEPDRRRDAALFRPGGVVEAPPQPARHAPAQDNGDAQARRLSADVTAGLPVVHFEHQAVAADDALRAGAALPQRGERPATMGAGGLPVREPLSQLAPGAVEATPDRADEPIQRDPATIGATYAAYARGLSGSRTSVSPAPDKPRTLS